MRACAGRVVPDYQRRGGDRYGYMQEGRGGSWWSGVVLGEMQYGIRRSMHADDEERACVRACVG